MLLTILPAVGTHNLVDYWRARGWPPLRHGDDF
jgi:hypothetical protein